MDNFVIDDNAFSLDEVIVSDLVEKGEILSGPNSGRRQDYNMYIEYGATYYNYSFVLSRGVTCSLNRWDELFSILNDPHCEHTITMPHDQGTFTFNAYIQSTQRKLIQMRRNANEWGDISVDFIAMQPVRRA